MAISYEEYKKQADARRNKPTQVSQYTRGAAGAAGMNDEWQAATDPFGPKVDEMLWGKDPQVDIVGESTLTPEQQAMLAQLIKAGPVGAQRVSGAQVSAQDLSLEGLEALQNQLAQSGGLETLQGFAAGGDSAELRKQMEAKVAPLQEQAKEQLATVGREYSAGGFFGSDREAADLGVQDAFAQAQAAVMADLVSKAEDRSLTAGTQLSNLQMDAESTGVNAAVANMEAQLQAALASGNNEQAARIQNSLNELQTQQLYQQLLGVQGKENIVTNEGGTSGGAGGIAGSILGAVMSDRRLKYDIQTVSMLPIGIPLVTWRWKNSGRMSFGVIAQDLLTVMPEAVIQVGKYLAVNYELVCRKLVSKIRTGGN